MKKINLPPNPLRKAVTAPQPSRNKFGTGSKGGVKVQKSKLMR